MPVVVVGCCPNTDDDGDGCTNKAENGPNERLGGQWVYLNYWNFYDTPVGTVTAKEKAVNVADLTRVIARFGATDDGGAASLNRNDNPTTASLNAAPAYHPAYDRGPAVANPWITTQADGAISISDLARMIAQFGHSCV